jgi:hypothetical protein
MDINPVMSPVALVSSHRVAVRPVYPSGDFLGLRFKYAIGGGGGGGGGSGGRNESSRLGSSNEL